MLVVGYRIDAGDIGRLPEPVGQLFDGNERLARENRALLRRSHHKRGVGKGIGFLQPVQRDDMRVVMAEMVPDIDIDFNDAGRARSQGQHDQQADQNGKPSPAHDERYAGVHGQRSGPSNRKTGERRMPAVQESGRANRAGKSGADCISGILSQPPSLLSIRLPDLAIIRVQTGRTML